MYCRLFWLTLILLLDARIVLGNVAARDKETDCTDRFQAQMNPLCGLDREKRGESLRTRPEDLTPKENQVLELMPPENQEQSHHHTYPSSHENDEKPHERDDERAIDPPNVFVWDKRLLVAFGRVLGSWELIDLAKMSFTISFITAFLLMSISHCKKRTGLRFLRRACGRCTILRRESIDELQTIYDENDAKSWGAEGIEILLTMSNILQVKRPIVEALENSNFPDSLWFPAGGLAELIQTLSDRKSALKTHKKGFENVAASKLVHKSDDEILKIEEQITRYSLTVDMLKNVNGGARFNGSNFDLNVVNAKNLAHEDMKEFSVFAEKASKLNDVLHEVNEKPSLLMDKNFQQIHSDMLKHMAKYFDYLQKTKFVPSMMGQMPPLLAIAGLEERKHGGFLAIDDGPKVRVADDDASSSSEDDEEEEVKAGVHLDEKKEHERVVVTCEDDDGNSSVLLPCSGAGADLPVSQSGLVIDATVAIPVHEYVKTATMVKNHGLQAQQTEILERRNEILENGNEQRKKEAEEQAAREEKRDAEIKKDLVIRRELLQRNAENSFIYYALLIQFAGLTFLILCVWISDTGSVVCGLFYYIGGESMCKSILQILICVMPAFYLVLGTLPSMYSSIFVGVTSLSAVVMLRDVVTWVWPVLVGMAIEYLTFWALTLFKAGSFARKVSKWIIALFFTTVLWMVFLVAYEEDSFCVYSLRWSECSFVQKLGL